MDRTLLTLLAAGALGGGGNAASPTTFDFDQGSYSTFAEVSSDVYRITPRKHFNNQWLWFAVRSGQWAGKIPHFLVAKADRRAAPNAYENLAVWSTSPDTDTWTKFDNQSIGASDIEFYHNSAFPSGVVYIAFIPMYPFSRTQRKIGEWAADARVVDTASTTNLVVDTLTARDNGDGRTAPALPLYGMGLTNNSGYTKNTMVLFAGTHPDETQGRYQLEGAMGWLLGGSAQAEFLLDWFNIIVYPCVNPQGVWGGYYRSSPQTTNSDNNRLWDGTGVNEAVDAVKTAIAADTGGAVEVGIDFHGAFNIDAPAYMDSEDRTAGLYAVYLAKMQALVSGYTYIDETVTTMLVYLIRHTYSANLAILAEATNKGTQTIPANWLTYGENTLKTIAAMHAEGRWTNGPGVGSRDMNGTTDRIDRASPFNPTGHAITVSLWVLADEVAHNTYCFCVNNTGDAAYGFTVNMPANNLITSLRKGTTDYIWNVTGLADLRGAWHHLLVTSDGGVLTGSTVIYLDGESQTISFVNGSGAEAAHAGTWSIGGRTYDDARNLDGHIAQVRVFDRVLTAGEIALEAAGILTTTSGLVSWFKGNTSNLADAVDAVNWTADGTTQVTGVGTGPAIYYP